MASQTQAVMQADPQYEAFAVECAQRGDLEAFNDLIVKYQDRVYRQAFWILGDEAAAEDAAQEAFYRAYRKIHTYCGSSFRAWILRITTNYCLDQLRRQKSFHRTPTISWEQMDDDGTEHAWWMAASLPTPEQSVEHDELSAVIQQSLLRLSPEDRTPIILIDIQEMNYQEAAEAMRVPMSTFKSRLSRARAKLLYALRPYFPPPSSSHEGMGRKAAERGYACLPLASNA
jgi:RNA polymerase sigma-70 factor (ECF subfamily)